MNPLGFSSKRCVGYQILKNEHSYRFLFSEKDLTTQEYISRILNKVFDRLYLDKNVKLNHVKIIAYTGCLLFNPWVSVTVVVISYLIRSQTLKYRHIYTVQETKHLFQQKQETMIREMIASETFLNTENGYTCLYGNENPVEFEYNIPTLTFIAPELIFCHVLEQYFKPMRLFVNLTACGKSPDDISHQNNYYRDIINDFYTESDLERFHIGEGEYKSESKTGNSLVDSLFEMSGQHDVCKRLRKLSMELVDKKAAFNVARRKDNKFDKKQIGVVFELLEEIKNLRAEFYRSIDQKMRFDNSTNQFQRYSCFTVCS